jgi:hypothetical protein|tara:strand:- start:237 stop:485 length:249 start_codon:yes stop_codon:yes gene_type:complete
MNYNDKLWAVKQFVEENFDDPVELTIALGMSVEDFINMLPDVLVANYSKFINDDDNEEDSAQVYEADGGLRENGEEEEEGGY